MSTLWQLAVILPLAVVHTLGNLFTNMSLGRVAVSFTHTIKAMEPFFSVVLSAMFLGEVRIFFLPFFLLTCSFYFHVHWNLCGGWSCSYVMTTNLVQKFTTPSFFSYSSKSICYEILLLLLYLVQFFGAAQVNSCSRK